MFQNFRTISGTIISEGHLQQGKPCQDAIRIFEKDNLLVFAQADGVSACEHAEIGANLLVDLSVRQAELFIRDIDFSIENPEKIAKEIRASILRKVKKWCEVMMIWDYNEAVHKYLTSTLSMVIMGKENTLALGSGDGFFVCNEELHEVETSNGAPSSICYAICDPFQLRATPNTEFKILYAGKTRDIELIGLTSDGLNKFDKKRNVKLRRNDDELVGTLDQFWKEKYFENPDEIQKRLNLITLRNGIWPDDDVSFVMAKRMVK